MEFKYKNEALTKSAKLNFCKSGFKEYDIIINMIDNHFENLTDRSEFFVRRDYQDSLLKDPDIIVVADEHFKESLILKLDSFNDFEILFNSAGDIENLDLYFYCEIDNLIEKYTNRYNEIERTTIKRFNYILKSNGF